MAATIKNGIENNGKGRGWIGMMKVKDILPSPFGDDVNPVATEAEDLSLLESIRAIGILVILTVGRICGKGKFCIVKGSRRLRMAIELGILEVLVEQKEYDSLEEMRQDAILDNVQRRQLPPIAMAKLANEMWTLYENAPDKKEMSAKGMSPRKRAAIAGGLSEGSLASFRYVVDSCIPEIIEVMMQGKLSIDAAYRAAKKEIDGVGVAMEESAPVKLKRFMDDLDEIVALQKRFESLFSRSSRIAASLASLPSGRAADRARATKKIEKACKALEGMVASGVFSRLLALLSGKPGDDGGNDDEAAPPEPSTARNGDKEDYDG